MAMFISKKTFFKNSLLVILTLFLISATLFFAIKNIFLARAKITEAKNNAKIISASIAENFDYTEKLLNFIGQKISDHNNSQDLEFIHNAFVQTANFNNADNGIFSWSKFDWVNKEGFQTVNTMTGINTINPPDMSVRGYTKEARLNPRKLKIVGPLYGYPSRLYVIPIGVGITNLKGSYLGLVAVGIDTQKISKKISQRIGFNNYFIVIDTNEYEIAFDSFGIKNLREYDGLIHKLKENRLLNSTETKSGPLKDIEFDDIKYVYALKMNKPYPYLILSGYSKTSFTQQFYEKFIPTFSQLIFLGFIAEIVLLITYFEARRKKY